MLYDENLVGYIGGIFITVSFLPQVIKSYRTKSVDDLSLAMILATLIGTAIWIWYGIITSGGPVIVMNSIFGVIVVYQLYLKIRYESEKAILPADIPEKLS